MLFMNLPEEYRQKKSRYAVLPVEYEKGLTWGDGSIKGAVEIIKASKHLEYYDEQFDCEPFANGIVTLPALNLMNETPEQSMKKIGDAVSSEKRFLVTLGGDHAVTVGATSGLSEDCSVIIFDAHADFFHSWNESTINHRCVSRRMVEKHQTLLVGVRSMDVDEADLIKQDDRITMIKAYEYDVERFRKELKKLKKRVYVSIDVDVFDPAVIRNTGTPEPGGFFWNELIGMLSIVFQEKTVVGGDIVEFAPKEYFDAEAFSLAKLAYKLMAMKMTLEM